MRQRSLSASLGRIACGFVLAAAAILAASVALAARGASASAPTQIAAGDFHTCALTRAARVRCWGSDFVGALGNGRKLEPNYNPTPVDVVGIAGGARAIDAGGDHSCAVTDRATVKCWGSNQLGQLGSRGPAVSSESPVDIAGLTGGVRAVSAGKGHTCALTRGNGVKCWGDGRSGQLGNGSTSVSRIPVDVTGLTSDVSAIAAATVHTCAVTARGGAKCWGRNGEGGLGNGSRTDSRIPVDVTGLTSGVIAIAAYHHTCALTNRYGVKCWGSNQLGELGNGSTTNSHVPVDVSGLSNGVSAIAAGENHTCALLGGGGVKCWGSNAVGQLGNGSTTASRTPVSVVGLTSGVSAIAAGIFHTCALMTRGGVKCWGYNAMGQLGNGSLVNHSKTPVDVVRLTSPGVSNRSFRLRWPPRPNRSMTYNLRFRAPSVRAVSLRVYGKRVPRGHGFDFIVACEHRGPAALNWNWAQTGGIVRIKVTMTTGRCEPPGPRVAGKLAVLTFRLVTAP